MKEGVKKYGWVAALILANQDTRINTAEQKRINLYVGCKQIKDYKQKRIVITELNFIYSLRTSFSLYVSGRLVVIVNPHLLADYAPFLPWPQ
ncbi:hypothetical protein GCM10011495_29580 [Hymenobacter frigidus]|uniref:Uncharacterized protein n=1 Tax=Hymenobacter frigidus TaxID=1524095 RepID=A0ABQ2A8Z7_9BACT|nr:hypothetical protein GCM10011495_29580 [Hymenobacter frigidus]